VKALLANHRGSILPAVLVIVFSLSIMIGLAFATTSGMGRHAQGAGAVESAVAIADGALDYAFAHWREITRTSPNPDPTTSEFAGIPVPSAAAFPDVKGWALKNFRVVAIDPLLEPLATTTTKPPKQTGRGPGSYSYVYLASADVEVPAINRTVTQKVRRVFQKKVQSPWNFALFYNDVLELHPNSPLNLNGWVHSNDNLYTGSNKLTLSDRVTTAGSWNIAFAPQDGGHSGSTATAPVYPADQPPAQEDTFQPFGLDPKLLSTTDTNANNDSYREITEVPTSGPDPFASQRYYNQAGVKVLISGSTITIRNQAGQICTGASKGNDLAIFSTLNAAIKNVQTFQDNREAGTMSAWTVDIGPITSSSMVWNNILYVSDQGATTGNRKCIRLTNGATLPRNGLTFVTDNPLYIHGNWNTGLNPPSNASTPDPTRPMDSSYIWRPSAILADSITLLSSAWQDNDSAKGLSNRIASNTTVNAALVAGDVPSGSKGNNYSGGGENFVRLLENWTGKSFTYYGSMLQLYPSALATGVWGRPNVYSPGQLNWYFDSQFTVTAPPGTAVMVSYVQQRWFQE
jgi:hypothetical protein